MESFIDQSFDDLERIQETVEDLRAVYPNLSYCELNVSLDGFYILKDFWKAELLETVCIERAFGSIQVLFIQTHYSTSVGRDGSSSASEVKGYVLLKLPFDPGSIFFRRERIGDKISELFKRQELKVKDDSVFNKKFYLLAQDGEKALGLFSNAFRNLLKHTKCEGLTVEIHNGIMLISSQIHIGIQDDLKEIIRLGLDISSLRY